MTPDVAAVLAALLAVLSAILGLTYTATRP